MLKTTLRRLAARLNKEDGQTLIEYALIATLIAIAAIVLLAAVGFDLAETFNEVEDVLGVGEEEAPVPAGDDDAEPGAAAA
jgi:Flp pilus assembly pilin Flp